MQHTSYQQNASQHLNSSQNQYASAAPTFPGQHQSANFAPATLLSGGICNTPNVSQQRQGIRNDGTNSNQTDPQLMQVVTNRQRAAHNASERMKSSQAQLPFSLENCFLMEQTRLLLNLDGTTSHEVDSIVECRGPQQGQEQQFKLEMCCQCCKGRRIQLSSTKLLQTANEPLKDLAMQTIEMHCEGLDISGQGCGSALANDLHDDFDMNEDDDEDYCDENNPEFLIDTLGTSSYSCQPRSAASAFAQNEFDQLSTQDQVFSSNQGHNQLPTKQSINAFQEQPQQKQQQAIDTMEQQHSADTMGRHYPNFAEMGASSFAQNPHELKDHDYDEEELNMDEQSEEGTADDYESQADNAYDNQSRAAMIKSVPQESSMGVFKMNKRPSLHEFEDVDVAGKRRRLDTRISSGHQNMMNKETNSIQLSRNSSTLLEINNSPFIEQSIMKIEKPGGAFKPQANQMMTSQTSPSVTLEPQGTEGSSAAQSQFLFSRSKNY